MPNPSIGNTCNEYFLIIFNTYQAVAWAVADSYHQECSVDLIHLQMTISINTLYINNVKQKYNY